MADKHLKIQGEILPPDYDRVRVTVLEQTHFDGDFGRDDEHFHVPRLNLFLGSGCKGSQKIYLNWQKLGNDFVYFKMHSNEPLGPMVMSLELWNKVREAAEIYNETFNK